MNWLELSIKLNSFIMVTIYFVLIVPVFVHANLTSLGILASVYWTRILSALFYLPIPFMILNTRFLTFDEVEKWRFQKQQDLLKQEGQKQTGTDSNEPKEKEAEEEQNNI